MTDRQSTGLSPSRQITIAITLALLIGAGCLRFHDLGAWSFAGDEIMTFPEVDSLIDTLSGPLTSQRDRLPRLIPLGYFLHYLDYELFGRDEFGSRVLMAILGTASVAILFLGLHSPLGTPTALAAAILMALWPEHLFQSQQNRFYITAQFFALLSMVAGGHALRRNSATLTFLACLAAVAALLSHTLQGLLLPGLLLAITASAWAMGRRLPWRLILVILMSGLAALGLFGLYLLPLARGWNAESAWWGYSLGHSLLASVNQVGWPVAAFAGVAAVGILTSRTEQGVYWLAWAGLWAGATMVLPRYVTYHPAYVFPLATSMLVLAAIFVGWVYEYFRRQSLVLAIAWMVAACGSGLPATLSYFSDGSRYDYRSAAHYIKEHWRSGDRIATIAPTLLAYYLPGEHAIVGIRGSNPVPALEELARERGRLWIVMSSPRNGKPEDTRRWLGVHCAQMLELKKKRYDYQEFTVEVFLQPPPTE